MNSGKKFEVLVEREGNHHLIVWADKGLDALIRGVEGVTFVSNPCSETEYSVWIDHRYEDTIVATNIALVLVSYS